MIAFQVSSHGFTGLAHQSCPFEIPGIKTWQHKLDNWSGAGVGGKLFAEVKMLRGSMFVR